ncbi:MAG TPA: tyrosine-type recombinase/integrase [Sphingobium sp.]|uniref:tyrosine-type recombinase/integrase n=1 Tax=Sphingobium sp. TaxID=1912891 RepID=UPI002ED59604
MERAAAIDLDTIDLTAIALPETGELLIHDANAKGLVLRLRASGARTWVVLERVGGKTTRRTLGSVRQIPLEAARRMTAALPAVTLATPDAPSPAPLFSPDARISDLMPRFLASGEKGRWKTSTVRNMRAVSDTHILPLLGARRVRDLTPEEVARWQLDVAAKSSAIRMALSTLSGLMLYAEDHGLRDPGSNPCRGLRKKQRSKRGQILPTDTVRRLWATLDKLHVAMPDACDAVRLLLLTGARRSEILSLEWDRILGPRAVLEDSKTGPRTIWLNAPARAILDTRRETHSGQYVFPAARIDGPMKVLDRAWALIRKEARLGTLRVHDLRHHFASVAVSNGIDLRLVGQLLGHHDIDSTLGYAHLATGALMRSATRVSERIDRSLRGEGSRPPLRQPTRRAMPAPAPTAPTREATHG